MEKSGSSYSDTTATALPTSRPTHSTLIFIIPVTLLPFWPLKNTVISTSAASRKVAASGLILRIAASMFIPAMTPATQPHSMLKVPHMLMTGAAYLP